jgi:hypothetical protein
VFNKKRSTPYSKETELESLRSKIESIIPAEVEKKRKLKYISELILRNWLRFICGECIKVASNNKFISTITQQLFNLISNLIYKANVIYTLAPHIVLWYLIVTHFYYILIFGILNQIYFWDILLATHLVNIV